MHASPGLPGVCGDLQYEVYASLNSRAKKVCSTSVICMDCFLFPSPQLTPGSINHSIHSWLETQPSGQANLTGKWSSFCAPAGLWNWVDHLFVTQTQWSLNRCKQDWQLRTLRKGCKLSKYKDFGPVIKVKVQLHQFQKINIYKSIKIHKCLKYLIFFSEGSWNIDKSMNRNKWIDWGW